MTNDPRPTTYSQGLKTYSLCLKNLPTFARHELSKHLLRQHETKSAGAKPLRFWTKKRVFTKGSQHQKSAKL